jgi:hypothetical protein
LITIFIIIQLTVSRLTKKEMFWNFPEKRRAWSTRRTTTAPSASTLPSPPSRLLRSAFLPTALQPLLRRRRQIREPRLEVQRAVTMSKSSKICSNKRASVLLSQTHLQYFIYKRISRCRQIRK